MFKEPLTDPYTLYPMLLFNEYLQLIKHLYIFRVIDCLNTIFDMQNEKDCLDHCNKFLRILDFE